MVLCASAFQDASRQRGCTRVLAGHLGWATLGAMELASYGILVLVVLAAGAGLVRPGAGAALGLLVFALEQAVASGIAYFVTRPTLWNQLSAFAVAVMLLSLVVRGKYRLQGFFRPVYIVALLFVGYFVWACSWGPLPDVVALAMNVGPYVIVQMILVPLLIQSSADARAMFQWIVVLGTGVAFVAFLHLDRTENVRRLTLGAAGSTESNMNPMALSEACALAAMTLVLGFKEGVPRWLAVARWPLVLGCLAVAGLASRGEAVAALLATVLAVFMVPEGSVGQRGLRLVGTALVGLASMYLVFETEVSTRYSVERIEGDAQVRYVASSTMLSVFLATPEAWFRGLGTNYSKMLIGIYPHNQPIQALTEGGVLGIALWLGVHGLAFRAYSRARRANLEPTAKFVLRTATALWIYFLLVGLKRGHVLDVWAISSAVLLERCCLVLSMGKGVGAFEPNRSASASASATTAPAPSAAEVSG